MKHTLVSGHFSRRFAGISSFAIPAILIVACGGAPPPEAAAPAAPAKPAPAVAADISAVPEPAELVVTARLNKPSQAEKVVGGWTSLPMPGADDIANLVTDLDVGSIIDLDAPIDVAVAVEGHGKRIKPAFAVALGVKAGTAPGALPHVKSTPLGGGIFKLEGRSKVKSSDDGADSEDDDSTANICEVIPAYGPSASRLVCGSSESAINALGPYLARTAPRVSYPADLHIEGRLDPVRETISQARQIIPMIIGGIFSDSKAGPAVNDLVTAALGDFVDAALDLDRIKIDSMLNDAAATATVTTSFRDTKSLIAQLAVAHPERADVAPAPFWHLPADSKGAFFGRGIDAKDLEHPRELLTEAMSKALDAKGIAPADRAAIADVFTQYFALLSTPTVFANGFDTTAAAAVDTKKDPKKDDKKPAKGDREERKEAEARGAWAIAGIDAPIAKVANVGKSIATTLHRPGVAKLVKEAMPDGIPSPVIVTAAVPAKLGLPKDTVHLTVTVVAAAEDQPQSLTEAATKAQRNATTTDGGKGKPAKAAVAAKPKLKLGKPYVLHWYFVPDAGRTWVGYGADEAIVAAHLKLALSTSTDPGTLQSRAGLDDLKTAKMGSGGFFTLRGILAPSPLEPIFHTHDRDMERMLSRLQGAPQKGETPMPIELRSTPPAGQGAGALEITFKIPRESVRDVVAAAIGR
ncbi:MAG: hypothetical protein ABI461_05590 [Polyangiaceae bacterium]